MKKMFVLGLATVVLSAAVPSFAEEAEDEGVVGWTPIAIGLASPVQMPWGLAKWDVFGVDFNLLYSDAPKMYGLGFGGVAMTTRDTLKGVQFSSLCNWNSVAGYGVRITAGANISFGDIYGIDVGSFAFREGDFWGWDTEIIGSYQKNVWGVQVGGLVNFTTEQSYGCTASVGGNMAKRAYGCQLAGVFNFTDELHGAQIGLVNYARECPWGFQIGIVNIIMDNSIKVLPLVNGYF